MAANIFSTWTDSLSGLEPLAFSLSLVTTYGAVASSRFPEDPTATLPPLPEVVSPVSIGSIPWPRPDRNVFFRRLKEHFDYLQTVSTRGSTPLIAPATAEQARRAWWLISEATGFALPIPAACTGPDGEMFYSWDRGKHHLELEIVPGRSAEFFYRDRETEALWGEDYNIGETLSVEAIEKLKLFI